MKLKFIYVLVCTLNCFPLIAADAGEVGRLFAELDLSKTEIADFRGKVTRLEKEKAAVRAELLKMFAPGGGLAWCEISDKAPTLDLLKEVTKQVEALNEANEKFGKYYGSVEHFLKSVQPKELPAGEKAASAKQPVYLASAEEIAHTKEVLAFVLKARAETQKAAE